MNLEAFCYAGLLTFPEMLPECIAILAEPDRSRAQAAAGELQKLNREDLVRRWAQLREREWLAVCARLQEVTAGRMHLLPPEALEWILQVITDADGREDPPA